MDLDIQFGDLEQTPPQTRRRPDRNKQFAVAAVQSPSEDDLPIFVDLDVMRDMEAHAQSDTTVELGGVLLGGQHHDEDGRPFVLVTDSLRAQHFEATKGSFKFTHDTWSQISRERDEFPDDLQMVGWYHTHPDWGVFLSGMDMFICDNFFNKPLDVALVIDPCRGDRGMFQWTGQAGKRIRRTDGFYLIASRFRQAELEQHVALLEGRPLMPHEQRYTAIPPMAAPVVNIAESRQAPWQMVAVLGMLSMQFLLAALLGWKILAPPTQPAETSAEQRIAELEEKLEELSEAGDQSARVQAQLRVLERVVGGLQGPPDDLVRSMEQLEAERSDLATQVETHRQAQLQYQRALRQRDQQIQGSKQEQDELRRTIDDLQERLAASRNTLDERKSEIAELKKELAQYRPEEEDDSGEPKPWWREAWFLWTAAGAVLVGLIALGLVWSANSRRTDHGDDDDEAGGGELAPRFETAPENDESAANNR